MKTFLQIIEQDLECNTDTATKVLDEFLNQYNGLQKDLNRLRERGLSNEEIVQILGGHNYLCEENVLCDLNYGNILVTIHKDLSLATDFTGYVEHEIINKFKIAEDKQDMSFEIHLDEDKKNIVAVL